MVLFLRVICAAGTAFFLSIIVLLVREVLSFLVCLFSVFPGLLLLVVSAGFGLLRGFAMRLALTEVAVLCVGFFLEETVPLLEVLILLITGEGFLGPAIWFGFAFGCFVTTVRTVLLEELFLRITGEVFFELTVRLNFTLDRFVTAGRFDFALALFFVTAIRFEVLVLVWRVFVLDICLRFEGEVEIAVRDLLFPAAWWGVGLCFWGPGCLRVSEAADFRSTF